MDITQYYFFLVVVFISQRNNITYGGFMAVANIEVKIIDIEEVKQAIEDRNKKIIELENKIKFLEDTLAYYMDGKEV